MSARYEVGELVNLEFRRVPVVSSDGTHLVCRLPRDGGQLVMPLDHAGLTVTRVAPKEWPPQQGDIWEVDGREWFARRQGTSGVTLVPEDTDTPSEHPDTALRHGPMRLVYRRGWSPKPEPAGPPATEPTEVDHRAATIAGLRELAAWLEANPGVPVASKAAELSLYAWQVTDSGRYNGSDEEQADALRRVGALIGAEVIDGKPGGQHGRVTRVFAGGVKYELLHVWQQPAEAAKDIAGEGGEVAGPGVGSATAPDESSPAGPAAPADDPPADAVSGDSRPQDRPGQTAVPVPVVTGDGAAVTPDVWVAVRRRGISYHQLDGKYGADYTGCGRAARANGSRITLAEAEALGDHPCQGCYGGAR